MRRGFVSAASLLAVLTLAPPAASAEETGAKVVGAALVKALKTGDLDAVVECYAPDAVLWLPDAAEARGAKAIREAYATLLSGSTVTDLILSNTVYETSQNLSVGWGNFALTLQAKSGGTPVVLRGRFTEIAKRIKGRWLYAADQASVDPPPPPPAAKP